MTKKSCNLRIEKLTTVEILCGVFLYIGNYKFPEQAVYRFFKQLELNNSNLAGRYGVYCNDEGELKSLPLRQTLSFLEMGKTLESIGMIPIRQFYQVRQSHLDSIRALLEERRILPAYHGILRRLADNFIALIKIRN